MKLFTQKSKYHKSNSSGGFTLIELMVAVTIFSIVMTVAAGTMISIVDSNNKARALQSVMNNLNFAVESMTRNMMFGYVYHCGSDAEGSTAQNLTPLNCTGDPISPQSEITFVHNDGERVFTYRLNQSTYQLEVMQTGPSISNSSFVGITSPEVKIKSLKFYVTGSGIESSTQLQPRILIVISGEAQTKDKIISEFHLQTTVSQRTLDQ